MELNDFASLHPLLDVVWKFDCLHVNQKFVLGCNFCGCDGFVTVPSREEDSPTNWQLNLKSAKSVADHTPLLALWSEASGKVGLLAGVKERSRQHSLENQPQNRKDHQQGLKMVTQLSLEAAVGGSKPIGLDCWGGGMGGSNSS